MGRQVSEEEYEAVKDKALGLGLVGKGLGRAGSVRLADSIDSSVDTILDGK